MVRAAALFAWSAAVAALAAGPAARGGNNDAPAAILSPKDGGKVEQTEDVEGTLKADGWPVLLVKPLDGNQPWWIQAPVEELKDKKFVGQVQFGDDKSTGKRFRLVVVVAKSKDEALKFERGKTRDTLPAGLPKSDPVTVTRN